jgi:succinate-semialdehyde dehydrogenase/glutarate-semialdehyde dehydrogenase
MPLESIDPTTGDLIQTHRTWSASELDDAVERAARAGEQWRSLGVSQRCAYLTRVSNQLRARRTSLAVSMTREMGKPIAQAEAEVDKCAAACAYFAEHAPALLQDETVATEASDSRVRFEPLGCVLAIMPWNFPLWQVFRFAAPTLAAGNVALLKHAPNVMGCAAAIQDLFDSAGFPEGVFTSLPVDVGAISRLVTDPVVVAVTLTGSPRAGRAVAAAAGAVLKKVVLELGGSDAFIVLADADLDAAVRAAVTSRVQNSGQSCIAAKRFIVESPIYERFEEAFRELLAAQRVGDPSLRDTDVGPLARADLREALDVQVRATLERGASAALGGTARPGRGFFYDVTLLTGVEPGMAAFDQETFGPVAALCRARDVEDALRLANRSRYGLGANVWTRDPERGRDVAGRLQAGNVAVNGFVKSDPRMPFGGIRESGHGRELGAYGLREFTNVKSIWIT